MIMYLFENGEEGLRFQANMNTYGQGPYLTAVTSTSTYLCPVGGTALYVLKCETLSS